MLIEPTLNCFNLHMYLRISSSALPTERTKRNHW